MKQWKIIATWLITAGLLTSTANATITYSIDRTIGSGSVTGTITTDGTLGRLSNGVCTEEGSCSSHKSNLVDWSLTLYDGQDYYFLPGYDSDLFQSGEWDPGASLWDNYYLTNFYATDSVLVYDFDATGYAMFQREPIGGGGPLWDLSSGFEEVYAGPDSYEYHGDHWEMYNARMQRVERSSQVVIGWAEGWNVPGPSSLALLTIGLAGIASSRRLKRS